MVLIPQNELFIFLIKHANVKCCQLLEAERKVWISFLAQYQINGLVQDIRNPSASAMILQSYAKPSKYYTFRSSVASGHMRTISTNDSDRLRVLC